MGILAYGSLGDDPGAEIGPRTVDKVEGVKTPFRVEFARASQKRDGAPTLVPVSEGGACVKAKVLVMEEGISEDDATDMLWRRETRTEGGGERYDPPSEPGLNEVMVRRLKDFEGLDLVLYAEIGGNIRDPTARGLAELAVGSARSGAGRKGRYGITYLICVKNTGVNTPLIPEYEREILRITGAETLEQAHDKLTRQGT